MKHIIVLLFTLCAGANAYAQPATSKTYAETQREKANADYNKAYIEGTKYNRNTPSKSTPAGDDNAAAELAEKIKNNSKVSEKEKQANSKYYQDMKKNVRTEREARLMDATRLIERKAQNYEILVAVAIKCGYSFEEASKIYEDIDSDKVDYSNESSSTAIATTSQSLFSDVNSAKANYKWQRLETPKENENCYRYIENNKLIYDHKSDNYSWAFARLNEKDLSNWSYAGKLTIEKIDGKTAASGLVLLARFKPAEEKATNILFMVNPDNQTYWFGTYDDNNNTWTTLNKYAGTNYDVHHPVINKFIKRKGATNDLSVTRSGNSITLFINNQKVEVIRLDNSNQILQKVYGVGIATNQKSEGSFEGLSFSVNR